MHISSIKHPRVYTIYIYYIGILWLLVSGYCLYYLYIIYTYLYTVFAEIHRKRDICVG